MELNLEKYLSYHSPGYVIEILKDNIISEYVIGNKCILPQPLKTDKNTLYDIASLTKVFTSTLVYIAFEENKLNINDYVYDINPNFVNLKKVRVIDLLSHNQDIWTDGYLGNCKSSKEFYNVLYTAYVKSTIPTYVDTHYIILSHLLENIYNKDFKDLCQEKIFDKLNLKNTTFNPNRLNTASNNYEHTNDKIIDNIYPGLIHDTKGRIAKELGITTGHASIFTTGSDLIQFLKSYLDCSLLKKETIDLMLQHDDTNKNNYLYLKNLSNKEDINEMYDEVLEKQGTLNLPKTYNYMGTRYKNAIKKINDVPFLASNNSITFSGFTGPMFTIDFDKKIIVVIMCNVMHNTKLSRKERKDITVEIMNMIFNNLLR